MAEYIEREAAIAKLTDLDIIEPNATMTDAKRLLADMPGAKAVSLHDIYRVVAGHSYYHGDRILSALSCIAEGKEVNPVRSADVVPVVYCKDCKYADTERKNATEKRYFNSILFCRNSNLCGDEPLAMWPDDFCSYGERKDGGADNG